MRCFVGDGMFLTNIKGSIDLENMGKYFMANTPKVSILWTSFRSINGNFLLKNSYSLFAIPAHQPSKVLTFLG